MKLLRRGRQVPDPEPQPFFPESALTTGRPPEGLVFDGFAWRDRRDDASEATRIAALEAGLRAAQEQRETDARPEPPPKMHLYFDGYCWRDRVDETREANRIARIEQQAAEQEAARGLPDTDGFQIRSREIRAANL